MNKIRRNAIVYFMLQGFGVAAWWMTLWLKPGSRELFRMNSDEATLLAFWMPDLAIMFAGSLVVAVLIATRNSLIVPVVWFVVGATAYATFYCFSSALMTDLGWLGFVMMAGATILSGNFAIALTPQLSTEMFRTSKEGNTRWILVKTFAQITVVWSMILLVLPLIIVRIESKIGIPQFGFPMQIPLMGIVFVLVSSIGISSAIVMSKIGRGTPLPLDAAPKMVVSGVYGYVRNPMAISGIGQGLVVGFMLGSPLVIAYALTGGIIWQLIYRRLEEDDLVERFGSDYESYRDSVRCWIPNFARYEPK